jgi:DNA-binding MarR family transcriptional regulator
MNVHESSAINAFGKLDPLIHEPSRLQILSCLFLNESREYPALQRVTGLSWGNLSAHLTKLEKAGLVQIDKYFRGKRPASTVILTDRGRSAFQGWRRYMSQGLRHLEAARPEMAAPECRVHTLPGPLDSRWLERTSGARERSSSVMSGRWHYPLPGGLEASYQPM